MNVLVDRVLPVNCTTRSTGSHCLNCGLVGKPSASNLQHYTNQNKKCSPEHLPDWTLLRAPSTILSQRSLLVILEYEAGHVDRIGCQESISQDVSIRHLRVPVQGLLKEVVDFVKQTAFTIPSVIQPRSVISSLPLEMTRQK